MGPLGPPVLPRLLPCSTRLPCQMRPLVAGLPLQACVPWTCQCRRLCRRPHDRHLRQWGLLWRRQGLVPPSQLKVTVPVVKEIRASGPRSPTTQRRTPTRPPRRKGVGTVRVAMAAAAAAAVGAAVGAVPPPVTSAPVVMAMVAVAAVATACPTSALQAAASRATAPMVPATATARAIQTRVRTVICLMGLGTALEKATLTPDLVEAASRLFWTTDRTAPGTEMAKKAAAPTHRPFRKTVTALPQSRRRMKSI
mmetsp:Transcript_11962/g.34525  ORF Transcript_11962/g.34525 Transcript_11962/m.34525 type:complete len:253 (-) Transcript_11962:354-1112(-)